LHFYLGLALDHNPPIYASCILGLQMHASTLNLLVKMGLSLIFLSRLALNHDPPNLCLLHTGITNVHHHALPSFLLNVLLRYAHLRKTATSASVWTVLIQRDTFTISSLSFLRASTTISGAVCSLSLWVYLPATLPFSTQECPLVSVVML
jgi:hypothetical protein